MLYFVLPDTANRAENYAAKSEVFQAHARKMAETASSLARSGVVTDRKLADDLISTSKKVGQGCGWGVLLRGGVRGGARGGGNNIKPC